jgi:hypothetical protein
MRWWGPPPFHPDEPGPGARALLGLLIPITALLHLALVMTFVVALVQLITTGEIFGWAPPPDVPLWADIVILAILLSVLTEPLRSVRRSYHLYGAGTSAWLAIWGALVWLGLTVACFWVAYHWWPDLHRFIDDIGDAIRNHRTPTGDQVLAGLRYLLRPAG